MKWQTMLFVVALGGASVDASAQNDDTSRAPFMDEKQYRERMNDIDHAFSELTKHRRVQNRPAVERESAKLAELFGRVESFWKARGTEERARFAKMARDGAEKAREAALRQNQKGVEAAIEAVAASCRGCHREPLEKFRIETEPP